MPLLLFASGARRVTLATLGLLQYLGPSIQFLLGVFVYHEPLSAGRGVGFALIWTALALYSAESWRVMQRQRGAAAPPAAAAGSASAGASRPGAVPVLPPGSAAARSVRGPG